jgi:hypothetical protein
MHFLGRRSKAPFAVFTALLFCLILTLDIGSMKAFAVDGDILLTLQQGATVAFANNSSSGSFIHISPVKGGGDCSADYAVYNTDGSVKACGVVSRGLMNVPAGGRAVVTNSGAAPLLAYGDKASFSAETGPSLTPALIKIMLGGGRSAAFTNTSAGAAYISSGAADYAVYNADGSLSACGAGSGGLHPVPSGGRLIATNNGKSEITAYGACEAFACRDSSEPALRRTSLAPEDTVIYNNNTSSDAALDFGRADFVIYEASGSFKDFGAYTSGSRTVPAGGSCVITNGGQAVIDIYGAYEVFTAEVGSKGGVSEPALNKTTLEPGDSHEYTNLTSDPVPVYSGSCDYASYDANGTLSAFAAASSGTHEVPAYGRCVVTNSTSAAITAYAPYDAFKETGTSSPALLKTKLAKDETVVYANNSSIPVNVSLARADYAVYDGSGAYAAYGIDASGEVTIPAYGKIVATGSGSGASVYGPQAVFKAEKSKDSSPALIKTTLKAGASVNYFNISSESAPVNTGRADYCLSLSGGYIYSFGAGGSGEYSVAAEGSIRLTNSGTYPVTVYAPSSVFMAWESAEPALYMIELAPGEKAVVYSTADYEQSLYAGKCQYSVYKYDGLLMTSRSSFGGGAIQVSPNGRLEAVNNGTSFITLYGPYSCFAAKNGYMCKYDTSDPGETLKLPVSALANINSGSRASIEVRNAFEVYRKAFEDVKENSVTAPEYLSLYMETAASYSAAINISGGEAVIDAAAVNTAADSVKSTLSSLGGIPAEYGVSLNRPLRTFVRYKFASGTLNVGFKGDFLKDMRAERIILDAPSYDIYLEAGDIKDGSVISASISEGNVKLETAIPVVLGLQSLSGDNTLQVLKGDEGVVVSKQNPVSLLVEGRIVKSGVYSVKTNQRVFADMSLKPEEMRNAVAFLASRGVLNGTSANEFTPDAVITRAETAAILVRLLCDYGSDSPQDGAFTDIMESDWFKSAAYASARLGLIGGYEDGTFKGRGVITKNELLTVAARILTSEMSWNEAGEAAVRDLSRYKDGVAGWAAKSVALASKAKLYPERVDGSFSGGEGVTRGDAVIIIYRLFMLLW